MSNMYRPVLTCLLVALFVAGAVALVFGGVPVSFLDLSGVLSHHLFGTDLSQDQHVADNIIWLLRIPRVLLAGLVGASLALAGMLMQLVLRNSLAEPYILGLSAGSALGAFWIMIAGVGYLGAWGLPLGGFVGALCSLCLFLIMIKVGRIMRSESIILAGVISNAFLGSLLSLGLVLYPEKMSQLYFWLLGSFQFAEWIHIFPVGAILLATSVGLFLLNKELNVLELGEERALSLGLNTTRFNLLLLTISSLLTAFSVAFVGIIGFVGLIVPHLMRRLIGGDYIRLIPGVLVAGALFMITCDLLARTLFSPIELPIGVVTGILGVPFFIYLMRDRVC